MLAGRDHELRTLRESIASIDQGGAVLALVGPAGIGKTALAFAIEGIEVHWGRAWEAGGAPAYWPWIQALGAIRSLHRDVPVPAPIEQLLARAVVDTRFADPAAARFALFDACTTYLAAIGTPLAIVLDDLHAADPPSLELLAFVARGLRRLPILIVATWRDAEGRLPPVAAPLAKVAREARVLTLGALNADDVRSILAARGQDANADAIHEHAGGNPLFVREAMQLFTRTGSLAGLATSGVVEAIVQDRMAHASPAAREVLGAAAAIGRDIDTATVAELLNTDVASLEPLFAELGSLVHPIDDGYQFEHALIRDAVYAQLPLIKRRGFHARLWAIYTPGAERGERPAIERAAFHVVHAHPVIDVDAVISATVRAANAARGSSGAEAAIMLVDRAHAVVGAALSGAAELALVRGCSLLDVGRSSEARADLLGVVEIARATRDPSLLGRAVLALGGEFVLGNVRGELVALLNEAIDALPADEHSLRPRLVARLAAALVPGLENEASLAMARAAIATVRGSSDDRLVLEVALAAGSALADFADPLERFAVNRELVARARTVGDRVAELRGLSRLVTDQIESGDVTGADATLELRDDLAQELALPRLQWQAPLFRSMRAMIDARWDECDAAIADAVERAGYAGDPNAERCIAVHRFFVYGLAGRIDNLVAHEPIVLRHIERMNGSPIVGAALSAMVAARAGETARAKAALDRITLEQLDHLAATMLLGVVADAILLVRDERLAPIVKVRLEPRADRNMCFGLFSLSCWPQVAAMLGRFEAMAGDTARAESLFASGLDRAAMMHASAHERQIRAWWTESMPPRTAPALHVPGVLAFVLARDDKGWRLERGGAIHRLPSVRGLEMLHRLTADPGRELHVTDLAAKTSVVDAGDAGEVLDDRARATYRQRVAELRGDIDEARARGHVERAEQLHVELETLTQELARAVGLGGRARRTGSAVERARIAVQRRIRDAIKKIGEVDAEVGRHLDWAVRTGTFCSYSPQ